MRSGKGIYLNKKNSSWLGAIDFEKLRRESFPIYIKTIYFEILLKILI